MSVKGPRKSKPKEEEKLRSVPETQKQPLARRHSSVGANLVGTRIRVYRNGDIFFKGIKVVINTRHVSNVQAFLDIVSEKIGLTHGAKKLYTLNGELIKSMDQLQTDKDYVAATNVFTPLPYGQTKLTTTANGSLKTSESSKKVTKQDIRPSRSVDPSKNKLKTKKRNSSSVPAVQQQYKTTPNEATLKKSRSKKRLDSSTEKHTMGTGVASPDSMGTNTGETSPSPSNASTAKCRKPSKKKTATKAANSKTRNLSVTLKSPPARPEGTGKGAQSLVTRQSTPIPISEIHDWNDESSEGETNKPQKAKTSVHSKQSISVKNSHERLTISRNGPENEEANDQLTTETNQTSSTMIDSQVTTNSQHFDN